MNLSDLSYEIADALIEAIKAADFGPLTARAKLGVSNASCSTYVDVYFTDADEDFVSDDLCIRISDHEARSYNRAGDFEIGLDTLHNEADVFVSTTTEEIDRVEYVEMNYSADQADVAEAVAQALAFLAKRATEELEAA